MRALQRHAKVGCRHSLNATSGSKGTDVCSMGAECEKNGCKYGDGQIEPFD
jgi:hypothetical protein